jgi:hypothetical protein
MVLMKDKPDKIKGATDGTEIGNVGDRLKVDSVVTGGAPGTVPTLTSDLRYDDMNVANGGIARDTTVGNTYVTAYEYTGSGLLLGYLITLEAASDEWSLKLSVDGNIIYELSTGDLESAVLYGYVSGGADSMSRHLGFAVHDKTIRWQGPSDFPLIYNTSIKVEIKYIKGGSKKFRAGLVSLTK